MTSQEIDSISSGVFGKERRISITRAGLRDLDIVMLDEAISDVDIKTEMDI